MDTAELLSRILSAVGSTDSPEPFEDALSVLYGMEPSPERRESSRLFREMAEDRVPTSPEPARLIRFIENVLRLEAPFDFDSYMLFMEWNRDPERQFYRPRRHVLYPIVKDYQDLYDGELDFLGVSQAPRTGKTTLGVFFLTFVMGNYPDRANVMSGHSDKLTKTFHMEAMSIIQDSDTYRFLEVFPDSPMVYSSQADETIHLKKKRRFPTLTCRSIDGTLTGAVEVGRNALLYIDDVVSDREEALSADRMDKLYAAYLNQLKDRMNDGAKQLFVMTRWVPDDPMGRIEAQYEGNPRYRFTKMPALDGVPYDEWIPLEEVKPGDDVVRKRKGKALIHHEWGKSNFEYLYGLGFSTRYYEDMRASLYAAGEGDSWDAKYMCAPRYIGGLMFSEDQLRFYDSLPGGEPDAIIAVCDTKDRGKDYACLPVALQYGEDFYIDDCVCDNDLPEVVEPKILSCLIRNGVQLVRFESNLAGGRIADDIAARCRERGHLIDVRKKFSTENKETRILVDSMWIKEHCLFRAEAPNADYRTFLTMLTHYSTEGKNKHDDAPDAMSMLKRFVTSLTGATVTPMKRMF